MTAVLKLINPSGARLDWTLLLVAALGVVLLKLGVDLEATDVLVTLVLGALGRGAAITAEHRAQREAALRAAESLAAFRAEVEQRQGGG